MGRFSRDGMVTQNECRAAMLSEVAFADTARVLKALARETGHDEGAVIAQLAQGGLEAALGVMSAMDGQAVTDAYRRHREIWRGAPRRAVLH